MKKNSILWCDSNRIQRRFIAIDAGNAAVDDILQTAIALHKTGVAQWVIYFGDKGTPTKQWGISHDQAKVIASIYSPISQTNNQQTTATRPNHSREEAAAIAKGG